VKRVGSLHHQTSAMLKKKLGSSGTLESLLKRESVSTTQASPQRAPSSSSAGTAVAVVAGGEFGASVLVLLLKRGYRTVVVYPEQADLRDPDFENFRFTFEEEGVVFVAGDHTSERSMGFVCQCLSNLQKIDVMVLAWPASLEMSQVLSNPNAMNDLGLAHWRSTEHLFESLLFVSRLLPLIKKSTSPRVGVYYNEVGSKSLNKIKGFLTLRASFAAVSNAIHSFGLEFESFEGLIVGVHVGFWCPGMDHALPVKASVAGQRLVNALFAADQKLHNGKCITYNVEIIPD
jgi:hypothetical protein